MQYIRLYKNPFRANISVDMNDYFFPPNIHPMQMNHPWAICKFIFLPEVFMIDRYHLCT